MTAGETMLNNNKNRVLCARINRGRNMRSVRAPKRITMEVAAENCVVIHWPEHTYRSLLDINKL